MAKGDLYSLRNGGPSSESVEMEFGTAKPGTGPDLFKETAFILGGVPETY
jgi:hypothetical protein